MWLFGLQDEEFDYIIENASLVYNNQLMFFDDHILNNKQSTLTKRISPEKNKKASNKKISMKKLYKPGSSSSPLSISFATQETMLIQ